MKSYAVRLVRYRTVRYKDTIDISVPGDSSEDARASAVGLLYDGDWYDEKEIGTETDGWHVDDVEYLSEH